MFDGGNHQFTEGNQTAQQTIINDLLGWVSIVRSDLVIIRHESKPSGISNHFSRQIPKISTRAQPAANMVREFGPFFIKWPRWRNNAVFLPGNRQRTDGFPEDVAPMSAEGYAMPLKKSGQNLMNAILILMLKNH
ncbi:MAG: hypothetical protein R2874_11310 [Desulfobacterales bacterium]